MDANIQVLIDKRDVEAVFTEWAKRYQANPEQFDENMAKTETPLAYGEAAANIFMSLIDEWFKSGGGCSR